MTDFPHIMTRYHLLHTDLVFYAFTIRKSINYAKNTCGGFAESHCESLWSEDWYTAVVSIYDTAVILNIYLH